MTRRPRLLPIGAVLLVASLLGSCRNEPEGDPAAFCASVSDRANFDAVFDELDPSDVPEATAAFETALETERMLRATAPDAVRPDIDVLIQFFEDLIDGLATATTTTGDSAADDGRPSVYDELRPRFDQVEAASDRVALYVSTNC